MGASSANWRVLISNNRQRSCIRTKKYNTGIYHPHSCCHAYRQHEAQMIAWPGFWNIFYTYIGKQEWAKGKHSISLVFEGCRLHVWWIAGKKNERRQKIAFLLCLQAAGFTFDESLQASRLMNRWEKKWAKAKNSISLVFAGCRLHVWWIAWARNSRGHRAWSERGRRHWHTPSTGMYGERKIA